jgi:hypothetical protein
MISEQDLKLIRPCSHSRDVRPLGWLSLGLASAIALGCTADISGPGGSAPDGMGGPPGTNNPGSAGTGGSSSIGGGTGGTTNVQPAGALPGPSLRLLTESQYHATLRTLVGYADELTFELEDDVALNGLHAIGSSNVAISPKATEAYVHAAELVAERGFGSATAAQATAGCDVAQAACAESFLADFGRRAFRRSLTAEEKTRFVGIYTTGLQKLGTGAEGMKYAVMAVLSSPSFIYRVEVGQPNPGGPTPRALTDVEVASKLAYFLWNGPPDKELLDLAESGGLKAPGALAGQAARLMAAAGFTKGLEGWFDDYLNLTNLPSLEKLPSRFPKFTPTLVRAMRTETLMVLSQAALGTQDFRSVFNSSKSYVNAELAQLYGVQGVTGDQFVQVDLPAPRRGLLGNASLLSQYAHAAVSSPTLRGKFVRQILMCQGIPAPPPDVDTTLPDESEAKTARERLTIHSTNQTCATCHKLMDPLGLGLENFDAIGQYRTQDNGANIDASGDVDGVAFKTPDELANALAQSPAVPSCLSRSVFRYAWGRLESDADEPMLTELTNAFQASTYQMKQLLTSAVAASSFVNVGELDP